MDIKGFFKNYFRENRGRIILMLFLVMCALWVNVSNQEPEPAGPVEIVENTTHEVFIGENESVLMICEYKNKPYEQKCEILE